MSDRHPSHSSLTPALRVVIVEDNLDIARMLRTVFEMDERLPQLEVTLITDGFPTRAFNDTIWSSADVALLDLMLPGVDGADIIAHLREHHPRVRIIVLSAVAHHRDTLDADAFFIKPADLVHIVQAVRGGGM